MTVLGVPVQVLEAASSIALTGMSTVVAVVALVFAYRQNVGWKPVVLVTESGLSGEGGKHRWTLHLRLEFWNRRKYPIAMRFITAKISGPTIIDQQPADAGARDYTRANVVHLYRTGIVAPTEHVSFLIDADFENESLDALTPLYQIEVAYFDPHLNKACTLVLEHKMFYPEFGWNKTPEERERCRETYRSAFAGE